MHKDLKELDIRPTSTQFEPALIYVLKQLIDSDAIEIHQEASPPWFHIRARNSEPIIAEMRRLGVTVQPHRS